MKSRPVLIVGGGLGGLATGLALARHGMESHVLEKSSEFVELGAGLQLGPNAVGILAALGVFDAVGELAVFPRRLVLGDAISGRIITTLDLGDDFRRRFQHPYLVMHRHDLLSVLLEACRETGLVRLETSREVVEVRQEEREGEVEVLCADRSRHRGCALVGADGLWSFVRGLVHRDELVHDHFVAYRGTLPAAEAPDGARMDQVVMWIGPCLHFVQYPLRRGELFNQVAVFKSDRFSPDADWGTPDELDDHYAPVCPEVRAGVRLIRRDRHWQMVFRPPIENWIRGRMTLLGDAAHPMLQYIAQGACQAIEDAYCLARELRGHDPDVDAALAAYQTERVPRTARVQRTAQLWGDICHVDGIGAVLRNALLGARRPNDYEHVEWLYGYERESGAVRPPLAAETR